MQFLILLGEPETLSPSPASLREHRASRDWLKDSPSAISDFICGVLPSDSIPAELHVPQAGTALAMLQEVPSHISKPQIFRLAQRLSGVAHAEAEGNGV